VEFRNSGWFLRVSGVPERGLELQKGLWSGQKEQES